MLEEEEDEEEKENRSTDRQVSKAGMRNEE